MGLYLTYTRNIYRRRVKSIFFFKDNSLFVILNKTKIEVFSDIEPNPLTNFKALIEHAEYKHISDYEIVLDKSLEESILDSILEYISSYLLDKELSIGLLTKEIDFIENNRSLFEKYGITVASSSHPLMAPQTKMDSFMFNKAMVVKDNFLDNRYCVEQSCIPKSVPKKRVVLKESFHDALYKLVIESGLDSADIYNRGGITRQVFSKIMCTPTLIPKKETVICLCIGLRLPLFEAQALLKTAGYILSESIALDYIVICLTNNVI